MKTKINLITLGFTNCYLIEDESLILIDGGPPNQGNKFMRKLRKLSIEPKDISLLLLTHGHFDHIGSANEIKKLTGCKVAINRHEKDCVEQSIRPTLRGIGLPGKFFGAMINIYSHWVNFPITSVDIVLEDKEFSLESYGIRGRVLYTPGHSLGSMSLLLDTGEALVGDLVMSGLPLRIGPGVPIFAEDIDILKESWRLLLNRGAKWIYPAHGNSFKSDALKRLL